MTGQIANAIIALQGMFRLIAFQPNWEWHFDMSMRGFRDSFGAALFTLPVFFLFIACQRYIGAETDLGQYLLIYIVLWLRGLCW
jgi:ABC-type maltose transport system permease subunit